MNATSQQTKHDEKVREEVKIDLILDETRNLVKWLSDVSSKWEVIKAWLEWINLNINQFMKDIDKRMDNIERETEKMEKRVEKGEWLDKAQTVSIVVWGLLIFILLFMKIIRHPFLRK